MATAATRRFPLFPAVLALVFTAGCDDQAREFAARTREILEQRSAQLAAKIAAESTAYSKMAIHAAEASRLLADSRLLNERQERAGTLALDYMEGRKPFSRWRADVAEYARVDHDVNRQLLTADMDAHTRFLIQVQALQIEQDKVDALATLLGTLARKRSVAEDLAAATTFATDAKTEFDKKVCAQLTTHSAGGGAAAERAKALFASKCAPQP
jgi:hypothetical protein